MAVLGEPWTVLVVRDLLHGVRRFDELVAHLGIARTVLARRLAVLVDAGLVETSEYREPGRRARREYRLTRAGHDLRPVLLALMTWGDAHLDGGAGPPVVVRHDGLRGAGAPRRGVRRRAPPRRGGPGAQHPGPRGPSRPRRDGPLTCAQDAASATLSMVVVICSSVTIGKKPRNDSSWTPLQS